MNRMKINKGQKNSMLVLLALVMMLLTAGAVNHIENEIVVEACAKNYNYEAMEGSQRTIMTDAYTNTVYNETDYRTLCRIVEAEASGEDIIGKIMVANVVLNRVEDESFPDSVYEVVYARGQFSPVSNGRINRVKVSEETEEAVTRALEGEDHSNGALYFAARKHASASNMSWFDRALTKVAVHGGHEFFSR